MRPLDLSRNWHKLPYAPIFAGHGGDGAFPAISTVCSRVSSPARQQVRPKRNCIGGRHFEWVTLAIRLSAAAISASRPPATC